MTAAGGIRNLKLVLLAAYLACDYQAVIDRVGALSHSFSLLTYLGLYGSLAAALAAAAFIPVAPVRLALACLFAAASAMLHSFEWATATPLNYNSFQMMVSSTGDSYGVIIEHGDVLAWAIAAALLLFVALALPVRSPLLPFHLDWFLPMGAFLGVSGMLYVRGGDGALALPVPFAPLAEASLMGIETLRQEDGPPRPVSIRPVRKTLARNIILIVDESIAANYLDFIDPAGVHSGLLTHRPGLALYNYGVAASATNCSAGSNKTLRFGGTRGNYLRLARSYPSIWAYAHAAGLRTVYLDGQRARGNCRTSPRRTSGPRSTISSSSTACRWSTGTMFSRIGSPG